MRLLRKLPKDFLSQGVLKGPLMGLRKIVP